MNAYNRILNWIFSLKLNFRWINIFKKLGVHNWAQVYLTSEGTQGQPQHPQ